MCRTSTVQSATPALERCVITKTDRLAPHIGKLTLKAPRAAALALPGQIIHLNLPSCERILRRPFGIYRTYPKTGEIEIVYQAVGVGTTHMLGLEVGDELDFIGPTGRGWQSCDDAQDLLLVAGGIGAVPLYMLAECALARGAKVQIVIGAQTADLQVFRADYEALLGADAVHICTDDGSAGLQGFTTTATEQLLKDSSFDYIASCGPEIMQCGIARIADAAQIACEVSLEQRMACGLGACLSCVVDTHHGKKRACVDGPVFDAKEVDWDA